MLAIAHHKMVDLWRRCGRHEALHDPFDELDVAAEPSAGADNETRRDLEKLLQQLPDAQRRSILLTKVEGLSVAEASRRTGVSESAIKVQVHRGLKRLTLLARGSS